MTTYELITQGIGFLGAIFFVLSYQFKNKKILLLLQSLSCLSFLTQFILLKAYAGAILNGIGLIKTIILLFYKKDNKYVLVSIVTCILISTILVAIFTEDYLGILTGIGTSLQTIGLFSKNDKKCRYYQILFTSPSWIIYDAVNLSIAGVITEILVMISSIIYLIKIKNRSKN